MNKGIDRDRVDNEGYKGNKNEEQESQLVEIFFIVMMMMITYNARQKKLERF